MAYTGVIADDQCGILRKATGKSDAALAVEDNIITKNDIAFALNPVNVNPCMHTASILLTVGFEKGFAYEHAQEEIVDGADCQIKPEQGSNNQSRSRQGE